MPKNECQKRNRSYLQQKHKKLAAFIFFKALVPKVQIIAEISVVDGVSSFVPKIKTEKTNS